MCGGALCLWLLLGLFSVVGNLFCEIVRPERGQTNMILLISFVVVLLMPDLLLLLWRQP